MDGVELQLAIECLVLWNKCGNNIQIMPKYGNVHHDIISK